MKLGKDVFVALAAVAWSDGEIAEKEAQALVHAAEKCGVDDVEAVKNATKTKVELSAIKSLGLSADDKILTYAIAAWLARVDGVVMPEEKDALVKLGETLGLADGDRTRASAAAFQAEKESGEGRPSRYDFGSLASKLHEVLSRK
jgi:tellurite resistance protein